MKNLQFWTGEPVNGTSDKEFALFANNVAVGLQKEAAVLHSQLVMKDMSTIINIEDQEGEGTVGCQTQSYQVFHV